MFSIFNFQFSIFSCMKNFEISETDKLHCTGHALGG